MKPIYCPFCGPWNGHPDGVRMVLTESVPHHGRPVTFWYKCPTCNAYAPWEDCKTPDEAYKLAALRFSKPQEPMTVAELQEAANSACPTVWMQDLGGNVKRVTLISGDNGNYLGLKDYDYAGRAPAHYKNISPAYRPMYAKYIRFWQEYPSAMDVHQPWDAEATRSKWPRPRPHQKPLTLEELIDLAKDEPCLWMEDCGRNLYPVKLCTANQDGDLKMVGWNSVGEPYTFTTTMRQRCWRFWRNHPTETDMAQEWGDADNDGKR